ncbi:MAG: glycosyltransferase family 4 protein [Desulfobacterales bacterium]
MTKNIGFVSTRFSGIDGVTLESSKWGEILRSMGHRCFWFAGRLDRDPARSFLVPEAHFKDEQNLRVNDAIFGVKGREPATTDMIHASRAYLKSQLHQFITQYNIDLLIVENALTIPMHVPLGLALTEVIAETQLPTIAHHHDFYWERSRYSVNAVNDYLSMAFPPNLSSIQHVVINSAAQEELAHRRGISSIIIPNVLDFENPPVIDRSRCEDFKHSLGLAPDDIIFLQPTRIVQRKGIEHAIELIKKLKNPRYKLVISHEAKDEGFEYPAWIEDYAGEQGVDLRLVNTRITDPSETSVHSEDPYTLWEIYPYADFVTYPSLIEGFGNAFLEAIYFRKPMLVNRYTTFVRDIEPLGFDLAVMDGFLSNETAEDVRKLIESPERREAVVNSNYRIATGHYSYSVLRKHLSSILIGFFGEDIPQHMQKVVSYLAKHLIEEKKSA